MNFIQIWGPDLPLSLFLGQNWTFLFIVRTPHQFARSSNFHFLEYPPQAYWVHTLNDNWYVITLKTYVNRPLCNLKVVVAQSDGVFGPLTKALEAARPVTRHISFPMWADYYIINATTLGSLSFASRLSGCVVQGSANYRVGVSWKRFCLMFVMCSADWWSITASLHFLVNKSFSTATYDPLISLCITHAILAAWTRSQVYKT